MRTWTRERLEWMRDVALPTSKKLGEAMAKARLHFGLRTHEPSAMGRAFVVAFGEPPGTFLDVGIASADNPTTLKRQIKRLQAELRSASHEAMTAREIRRTLGTLAASEVDPPQWLQSTKTVGVHGVPTLFISDVHYAEVVTAAEVHDTNSYNSQIASDRLERCFKKFTHLFSDVMAKGTYPGCVLALGGDMLSGIIHDELRVGSDQRTLPSMLRLRDLLVGGIDLLTRAFGRVFVPCVVGNHGRFDRKPRAKGGPQDNFEYLLYHLIASHYRKSRKVTVHVSESFSTHWRVYGTTYLMIHGDAFRGGTGITGPLTPWAIGEHRLRKQGQAMSKWKGAPVHDVLLFGHWHTLVFGPQYIANGCVKGFDEYALKNGFSYEPPQQAAWLTHPAYGPSLRFPIFCERESQAPRKAWLEVMPCAQG